MSIEPDALHSLNRGVAYKHNGTHRAYGADAVVGNNLHILERRDYGCRDEC